MNRVYKVIWSKAKHCYVVTSEIAKGYGKSAGSKGVKALLSGLVALSIAMGGYGLAGAVFVESKGASEGVYTTEVYTTTEADGKFAAKTVEAAVIDVVNTVSELGGEYTALDGKVQAEAAAREAGDKTLDDRITAVKDYVLNETGKNYVSKADDAAVQDAGVVKKDKKIGENVTALGKGLYDETAARIFADKAQDEVIQKVNENAAAGIKTLAEAYSNEVAARKAADVKLVDAVNSGITLSNENVLQKNTTTVNADGNVTTKKADVTEMILNKGKDNQITFSEDGIKVGKNSTTMDGKGIYAGSDYDYGTAKAALDATEGKIKGAAGKFTVDANGQVTANGGVDTNSGGILTRGGKINAGSGDISGGNISASGNLHADGDISGKDISGKDITGSGTVRGRVVTDGIASMEGGKVQGTSVSDGIATLSGGSLTGAVNITTKNLTVTDGFKTDHITLGSETNNYTDINKGKVTSKIHEISGAVEYTAESIFNKDGSSITVRTNEGRVDSTGSSTVGSQIITQYLGNNAVPGGNNVTRRMVRNDNGTFSMVDTAVVEGKSSTVSQNAGERKVTVAEGTKNLNITENLTNGIVSETQGDDGTVTLTQGMDGTYKVVTSGNSTEDIGGQKVENYKGGLATEITGDETHHVTQNQTITVTGKSSLSAADIENKASSSIWNHVGEGYNTSWKMTDGTVVESVKDVSGKTNQITTTAADTYQFVKDGDNTLAKRTSSTNDNLNITDSNNTYTKITTATGNKQTVTGGTETASTNLTKEASNTLIKNGTQSVLNHIAADTSYTVMNENGNGSRQQQTASEILDRVTDGKNTSEVKQTASEVAASAKDISNTATDKIISQIGEDGKVKSEMNAEGITNTAENGTITNKAQTVNTITGKNTVTSKTEGTTFVNTGANAALKKGNEQGSRTETRIFGNQVETGKVETDFADVNNNLTVGGSTTLGRDGNTNLTVNSKSEFKDTVKMEKTLDVDGNTTLGKKDEDTTLTVNSKSTFNKDVTMNENATVEKNLTVNGESTFNNKVTITKNGLDVTGGTTTDKLEVKGTSEFGGKAAFKDDVSMGKNLTVTGKTETGILHVNGDGYVGGDLNVEGNIETHDAELSENSRQVVTGRQLYQTNERVDRLDNRIKKVGANAAALAALRPGDFNPDDKFSIAAGFGSYRNANAAALGLFYRPNENVLLSLGTSFGDGENMVNAGVSVKFGRGKSMAERRKEMADEVSSMRDEMRSQDERIAELEEMLKKQSELIEKLSKES